METLHLQHMVSKATLDLIIPSLEDSTWEVCHGPPQGVGQDLDTQLCITPRDWEMSPSHVPRKKRKRVWEVTFDFESGPWNTAFEGHGLSECV